jgi:hypothetical protein
MCEILPSRRRTLYSFCNYVTTLRVALNGRSFSCGWVRYAQIHHRSKLSVITILIRVLFNRFSFPYFIQAGPSGLLPISAA